MSQSKRDLTAAEQVAITALKASIEAEMPTLAKQISATVDKETGKITNYMRVQFSQQLTDRVANCCTALKDSGHYLTARIEGNLMGSALSTKDGITLFSIFESSFQTIEPGQSVASALLNLVPKQVSRATEVTTEAAPF